MHANVNLCNTHTYYYNIYYLFGTIRNMSSIIFFINKTFCYNPASTIELRTVVHKAMQTIPYKFIAYNILCIRL